MSEQKGGVDQLITDHKGKPLFGLKALQSIGKNEEESIYEDMPEPPVSPQLKELVLRHENHASKINVKIYMCTYTYIIVVTAVTVFLLEICEVDLSNNWPF